MRPALAHSPINALQRAQKAFRRLQQGSEPANGYSPLFCIGLASQPDIHLRIGSLQGLLRHRKLRLTPAPHPKRNLTRQREQ